MLMIIWWREVKERERAEGRESERAKIAVEFVPGEPHPLVPALGCNEGLNSNKTLIDVTTNDTYTNPAIH